METTKWLKLSWRTENKEGTIELQNEPILKLVKLSKIENLKLYHSKYGAIFFFSFIVLNFTYVYVELSN